MSQSVDLIYVLGIELNKEAFKELDIIPEEDWKLDWYDFGVKYGGNNIKNEDEVRSSECNSIGWTVFPKESRDAGYRKSGCQLTFILGFFFEENQGYMTFGDGTGGMCLPIPDKTELEEAKIYTLAYLQSVGIKNPDLKLYAVSKKC